jgi:citrate lyase subunit beta/citryl-CoA lyase
MRGFFPVAPIMVSMDNEKHISKVDNLEVDTIILNLEDGVANKKKALQNCKNFLKNLENNSKKFVVRVNSIDKGGLEEIVDLNLYKPHAIRVPKIRMRKDVELVEKTLSQNIDLHLSIETKEAWLNLSNLKTSERVTNFYLGILDLFADLGLSQNLITPKNPLMQYTLSHFLITSKAIDVNPVAPVFQDYKNRELFSEWLKLENELGFHSKGALSPTQAKEIIEKLSFSEDEVKRAFYIKTIFEENSKNGINGFSDEKYGFIDEPIYKGALNILNYKRS